MQVDEASALEDTLARLRQRYALHFYVPEGGDQSVDLQSVQVDLAEQARIRYQNAEVRSRRVFMSGSGSERAGTTVVTRTQPTSDTNTDAATPSSTTTDESTPKRRRTAVNDSSGPQVNTVDTDSDGSSGSSQRGEAPASTTTPKSGGWPKVNQQSTKP